MSRRIEDAFLESKPTQERRDNQGKIMSVRQKPSQPARTSIPLSELGIEHGPAGKIPKDVKN